LSNNNHWTSEDIPDLTNKTAIVTGANCGIGYTTAQALAKKGACVILACRCEEKRDEAAQSINSEHPGTNVVPMQLDLADLASVRGFVEEFRARYQHLDILVNNAGVMALPQRIKTVDGFEMQFATNHLGHFALTGLLIDQIIRTPEARIVTISSTAHTYGRIDFKNLNAEKSYSRQGAYGQSKLANLLFTYELQRRFETAGVDTIAVAAHPGWTSTNLQAYSPFLHALNPLLGQSSEMGALPSLYAATAPGVNGGDFYGPDKMFGMRGYPRKIQSSKRSHDHEVATRLWQVSEELTGVKYSNLN
jgi:NAD(P)-dependent dehydrogenase (short-subunit alcohol dehydrogenase family)